MELCHRELKLRHAVAADAGQLAEWWNDGAVMDHAGYPNGLGTTAEEVAQKLAGDADRVHRRIIIEEDGRPIGEMNYRDLGEDVAEMGIKICVPTEREKGLGRRALSLLITYLFEELGYQKIILDTGLDNLRAQHVYESLGFRKVRVNLDAFVDQLGRPRSSVDYELIPGEFVSFLK